MLNRPLVSLVVAAFNERENLPHLYERVCQVDWESGGCDFELLVVDDHSNDGTDEVLKSLATRDPRVKWMRFSRNFGSHKAFTAGLESCAGDVAILLAADLQDPPEFALELLDRWRTGDRVVWAFRQKRQEESLHNRMGSLAYYWLMRHCAKIEMPSMGADFLLIDRIVIDALKATPEHNTSLFVLIQWMGFRQAWIPYTKEVRRKGRSKWTFWKRVKLALDSLVGFSYFPIRFMSLLGLAISLLGLIYAAFLLGKWFFTPTHVEGWTSLICVVLILSGFQLMMLGILGEYLWRVFDETRCRPRFLVEASHGLK